MKILHVNYSDNNGGAAIHCSRLVEALNKNSINSSLLVTEKNENIINTISQFDSKFDLILHKFKKLFSINIKKILGAKNIYKNSISLFDTGLAKKINGLDFDVINLNWVCNEMISLKEIKKINKPMVWTLADMWPFIGSLHYTENDFYRFPNKKFDQKKFFNVENWVLNRKIKYFSKDIVIICISKWLEKLAKQRYIFRENKIYTIPCTIDSDKWKSIGKDKAKKILKFDISKKYFLFSAFNGITDNRKGFDLLLKSLTKLDIEKNKFTIVILGNADGLDKIKKTYDYNFIIFDNKFNNKNDLLITIYSACDILIVPSRLEAFGLVALEAGACSLPCVSFKGTGVEDIIEHNHDGYLAEYLNIEDLAKGINLLNTESTRQKMSINIRNKIIKKFSYEAVSSKYRDIYKKLI